jgi:hypothetical protein
MNDNENKRMIGDYEVLHAVSTGPLEIAIGCNLNADPGERYICAYCTGTGFLMQYSGVLVSDDYAELLQTFGNRIAEQAERLKVELAQLEKNGIEDKPITHEGFIPIAYEDDLKDKVIVIRAEVLKPEYQRATRQYQLCTGGFGASPNSRGSACFCTNLYSGKTSRYERMDVLGIVPKEQLPDWAKSALEHIEMQKNHDRGEAR